MTDTQASQRHATRYGGVVKLRQENAPAVLVTPRRVTPGGQVQMQPHDTRPAHTCVECGAEFWSVQPSALACGVVCRRARARRPYTPKQPDLRHCLHCRSPFRTSNYQQKYCGKECQRAHYYGTPIYDESDVLAAASISPGTRGAMSELRVCVDLMARGFHVYRAMSPSCPSDLVVWKERGRAIRIEVKTARKNMATGNIAYQSSKRNVFEVICYVAFDELIYIPPVEEWGE
jgi:hypothetical protein